MMELKNGGKYKEEYIETFPELVESIRKSHYSFDEISKEILINEFYDCYVYEVWVSYESTGWAGYRIETFAESDIEDWKNDDNTYGWGADKIRIKNIPERDLDEIVKQIKGCARHESWIKNEI